MCTQAVLQTFTFVLFLPYDSHYTSFAGKGSVKQYDDE